MSIAQERDWTLDDVMQLTSEKITDLWKSLPSASLQELHGEYEGHMPMVGADEEFIAQINETMRNEDGPFGYWIGKAFKATDSDHSEGYNHWRKAGTNGIRNMRYKTFIEVSEIDGKPSLMMDYGPFIEPDQEWYFKDEVRKLNEEIHLLMGVSVTVEGGERTVLGPIAITGPIHDWVGADEITD